MIIRKRLAQLALIGLVGTACADQPQPVATEVEGPEALENYGRNFAATNILDARHGGNPNFRWLAPVHRGRPPHRRTFNRDLSPEVEICNKNGECTRNRATRRGNHYQLNLKKGINGRPKRGSPYEIRVYGVGDYLLGSLTLDVASNRNYPLKFWIGKGFNNQEAQSCVQADRCNLGTVVDDDGGTVTVTTSGPNGPEVIAGAIFPPAWSPGGIDRAVIIDCRNGLPSEFANDGSGPLNTGLTQLPWYCDFSVDPPLAQGESFNQSVVVEVCETRDDIHGDVVLGKTHEGDFQLLPFVAPTTLGSCSADYTRITTSASSTFWGGVSQRLSAAFEAIGPAPLHAFFRDGGAGGTAISFSSINPVIPAEIDVQVVGNTGGLEVSLTRGGLPVASGNTNGNGVIQFDGLVDGQYAVTITGTTTVVFQGGPSQNVDASGSGPYAVTFQPVVVGPPAAGVISGTIPTAGSFGFGQRVTINGQGFPAGATVQFTQGATTIPAHDVWGASSTRFVVRTPPTGLSNGPVDITITSGAGTTNIQSYTFTAIPGAPVLTNPSTGDNVQLGASLLVEAHGIDTNSSRFQVELIQGATTLNIKGLSVTAGPNGLPANIASVPLGPPLVVGPAVIRMRVGNGFPLPFGPWATVNVNLVN